MNDSLLDTSRDGIADALFLSTPALHPLRFFLQILPKKSVFFEPLSDKTKFVEMNIFALKEDVVFNKLSLNNVYVELSHSDRVSVSPSCAS